MDNEDLDGKLYKNWVRGAKGLEFLQTGLKDFVGDKAPECRDQQLQNISNSPIGSLPHCNQCNSQNLLPEHANPKNACGRSGPCIQRNSSTCFGSRPRGRRKCPNGICSKLYDAIVYDHCYNDPLWKNTDPTTWCSDPGGWSFAKCFETTPGPATSAQETDASGLLSILLNNLSMQNWLACHNMGSNNNSCPFYKARYIRNEILHKSKMELEDLTLDEYIDTFIAVLEDPKCLLTYTGAQDAVSKLKQLKSKQIHISQKDEKDILKIRKEALSELEDETNEALRKIQGSSDKGVAEVNKSKVDVLQEIEKKKSTGITAMSEKTTEALKEIEDATSTGLTAVSKERLEALKELQDKMSTAVTTMIATRTDALKEMDERRSTGLTAFSENKAEALKEIEDTMSTGVIAISNKRTNVLQEIEDTTSTGLTAVSEKKSEALKEIDDKMGTVITAIKATRTDALKNMEEKIGTGVAAISEKNTEARKKIEATMNAGVTTIKETRTEALNEMEGEKNTGVTALYEKKAEALKEIQTTMSAGVTKLTNKGTETITEIENTTGAEVTAISEKGMVVLRQIEDTASTGLTRMNKTKTEAEQEITEMKRITLDEVSTKGTETLGNIDDRRHEILSELEGMKSDIFQELKKQKPLNVTPAGKGNTTSTVAQPSTTISVSCDTSGADAVEDDDSDTKKTKTVLDKAWGKLIDFMNPDPILKCATEYDLFGYRQARDISGEKNTTDKNRKILENVTRRGKTGYENFKESLYKTDQSKLALLLEYIERGEDTSSLLKQIQLLKDDGVMHKSINPQIDTSTIRENVNSLAV